MSHFWDKYFDKILIALLFVYVFTAWVVYGIPEVRDISRDLIIALVALASGRRSASTEITTDTVSTPAVNTNSMDNARITAESVSTNQGEPDEH